MGLRAVVAGALLLLAGCVSPDSQVVPAVTPEVEAAPTPSPVTAPRTATVFGCPVQTLIPQASRETCGGRVISQLFSGLVELDPVSGQPELLVAEAITSEDAQQWTIRLADGWRFHDGEPVTATSFVNAWNLAANPDHGLRSRDLFADIAGFEAVASGERTNLSGLEVVDDLTMVVTLDRPFAPFLAKLSDAAFAPLPSIAYEDLDAFGRAPIGNGRFRLVSFDPEREIRLQRFDDWAGQHPAQLDEVSYLIYAGNAALETAYLDVRAGALDVLETIPATRRMRVDEDFGTRVLRAPTSSFAFLGMPVDDDGPLGSTDVRRALSLAIDRQQIIDDVLGGGMVAAASLIPPVLEAHRADACDVCRFDPDEARALLDAGGGWEGPMTVAYSTGGDAETWLEAIATYWREELGISDVRFEALELAAFVRRLEERTVEGPFSLRWSLSYLSPEYALSELYRSTGGANFFGYANPAFDVALDEANAADANDASLRYREAEDLVLADMPAIPLWYASTTAVYSDRVEGVVIDARGYLRVELLNVANGPR